MARIWLEGCQINIFKSSYSFHFCSPPSFFSFCCCSNWSHRWFLTWKLLETKDRIPPYIYFLKTVSSNWTRFWCFICARSRCTTSRGTSQNEDRLYPHYWLENQILLYLTLLQVLITSERRENTKIPVNVLFAVSYRRIFTYLPMSAVLSCRISGGVVQALTSSAEQEKLRHRRGSDLLPIMQQLGG